MSHKVAVVGDADSIYGFGLLGIEVFAVQNPQEALLKIKSLSLGEYAIIYVTEKLISDIYEDLHEYDNKLTPAIIAIPGVSGNVSAGGRLEVKN